MNEYDDLPPGARVIDDSGFSDLPKGARVITPEPEKPRDIDIPYTRMGVHGLTLGHSDELEGLVIGAFDALFRGEDFVESYVKNRDRARDEIAAIREQHPVGSTVAEFGAGLGLGATQTAQRATSTVPRAIGSGALGAGVYGAGESEGGVGETLSDFAQGAAVGGIFGTGAQLAISAARGAGTIFGRVANKAKRVVADELKRFGFTLDDAVRQADDLGPDARLADVLPDLASDTARFQGGRNVLEQFLNPRMKMSQRRIEATLKNLNRSTANYFDNLKGLDTVRKQQAEPLYQVAYSQTVGMTDELRNTLMVAGRVKPVVRQAWNRAKALYENEGIDIGPFDPDKLYSVRALDRLKRGLDAIIEQHIDSQTGKVSSYGRTVIDMKNRLLRELDDAVPEYGVARQAWAGPSTVMKAQELGRRFLKEDFEITRDMVQGMSAAEKEGFLIGATRAVRDRIMGASDTSNVSLRFTPLAKERLRWAFPDDDSYNKFIKALDAENHFQGVRNKVLAGSPTADRAVGAGKFAMSALRGDHTGLLSHVASMLDISDATAKEVAKILTQTGMTSQQLYADLARMGAPSNVIRSLTAAFTGMAGAKATDLSRAAESRPAPEVGSPLSAYYQ